MSLYASPALADSNTTATASDSPGVASGNNVQVPVNVPLNICGNTVDVIAALNPAFGNSCANGPVSQGRHAAPHHPAQHGADSAYHPGRGAGHGGTDHAQGPGGHAGGHRAGHGGEQGGYGDSSYGDSRHGHSGRMSPGYGDSGAHHGGWSGASSYGETHGSPGVLSGNQVAAPVDLPVELCGNTLDVIGIANPVSGNSCAHHHATTPHHWTPPATPPRTVPQPPKTPVVHTPVTVHEQPPVPRQYTPPTLAETGGEGVLANAAISVALMTGGALLYRRSRAQSRP
ncbi:chaplin [Streptomyces sp. NBC_00386]|uniref:chaplin n=1 Tax=Streptomyces sp. NBC_00386 TaxID=2975734 RepID=UPI002E251AC4